MSNVNAVKRSKRLRRRVTLDDKIQILERLKNGETSTALGRTFGINESTIRGIKRNESAIRRSAIVASDISAKTTSYIRNWVNERMERALVAWIEEKVRNGVLVSGTCIKLKALEIYEALKEVELSEPSADEKRTVFRASSGWLSGFLRRHALHTVRAEGDSVNQFIQKFVQTIADDGACSRDSAVNGEVTVDGGVMVDGEVTVDVAESSDNDGPSAELTLSEIYEGLQLANQLRDHFLSKDPNSARAEQFRRDLMQCMSDYKDLYVELSQAASQRAITKSPSLMCADTQLKSVE